MIIGKASTRCLLIDYLERTELHDVEQEDPYTVGVFRTRKHRLSLADLAEQVHTAWVWRSAYKAQPGEREHVRSIHGRAMLELAEAGPDPALVSR